MTYWKWGKFTHNNRLVVGSCSLISFSYELMWCTHMAFDLLSKLPSHTFTNVLNEVTRCCVCGGWWGRYDEILYKTQMCLNSYINALWQFMSCGRCWYQHWTIVWVGHGQHEIGEVKLRKVKVESISKSKVMRVSFM